MIYGGSDVLRFSSAVFLKCGHKIRPTAITWWCKHTYFPCEKNFNLQVTFLNAKKEKVCCVSGKRGNSSCTLPTLDVREKQRFVYCKFWSQIMDYIRLLKVSKLDKSDDVTSGQSDAPSTSRPLENAEQGPIEQSVEEEPTASSRHLTRGKIKHKMSSKRLWWYTDYGKRCLRQRSLKGVDFTVMSYNVLAQNLLENHMYLYYHCNSEHLEWEYRAANLLRELKRHFADVICLQELQEDHFNTLFNPYLQEKGYSSIYKRKTGDTSNDGCAIFFKKSVFSLDSYTAVEFKNPNVDVLNRHNVGLIAVLRPQKPRMWNTKLCVATTHLLFNPRRGDVKLSQLRLLLAEIEKLAIIDSTDDTPCYHPIILCGDMNSEPFSPLYDFITSGTIHYAGMLSGDVSGQGEGFRRGKFMTADSLDLSSIGINIDSQYENGGKEIIDLTAEQTDEDSNPQGNVKGDSNFPLSNVDNSKEIIDLTEEKINEDWIPREDLKRDCSLQLPYIDNSREIVVLNEGQTNKDSMPQDFKKDYNSQLSDVGNSKDIQQLPIEEARNSVPLGIKFMAENLKTEDTKHTASNFSHNLNFVSTYKHVTSNGFKEITSHNASGRCTVDYIFYNVKHKKSFKSDGKYMHKSIVEGDLKHIGCYGLLYSSDIDSIRGLPNAYLSSDHLCLISRFLLTQ